jgi:hypothetical protein
MMASTSDVEQRHLARLTAFVLRARRVQAHSLYKDYDALERIGTVPFEFEISADGVWMTQRLPPEEVVESAAARVRPLLLKQEDAHFQHTLTALGWLLRDNDRADVTQVLVGLKQGWAEFDSKGRGTLAYAVQTGRVDEEEVSPMISDNVLAFAWIYGDVVHGDAERLAETEQHGVRERYRAAAPLVCRLIMQTTATLHVIEWLIGLGLLTLPDEIFEREVVVTDPVFREHGEVHMAPLGTKVPDSLHGDFGPEWRRLTIPKPGESAASMFDVDHSSATSAPD